MVECCSPYQNALEVGHLSGLLGALVSFNSKGRCEGSQRISSLHKPSQSNSDFNGLDWEWLRTCRMQITVSPIHTRNHHNCHLRIRFQCFEDLSNSIGSRSDRKSVRGTPQLLALNSIPTFKWMRKTFCCLLIILYICATPPHVPPFFVIYSVLTKSHSKWPQESNPADDHTFRRRNLYYEGTFHNEKFLGKERSTMKRKFHQEKKLLYRKGIWWKESFIRKRELYWKIKVY